MIPGAKFGRSMTAANPSFSREANSSYSLIACGVGVAVVAATPVIHLALVNRLWDHYKKEVSRDHCSCSCWDGAFKGFYEAGLPGFKHVYFNSTSNTLKMWLLTVVVVIALYECVRRAVHLQLANRLRLSMLLLFALGLYSHYYAWWAIFNFWNDDYYRQWYHQLLFSSSEVLSTVYIVQLMDIDQETKPGKLIVIIAVGAAHCLSSFTDQFGKNVLLGQGLLHQVLRDVGFMVSDVTNIVVCLRELKMYARKHRLPPTFLVTNSMAMKAFFLTAGLWISSVYV